MPFGVSSGKLGGEAERKKILVSKQETKGRGINHSCIFQHQCIRFGVEREKFASNSCRVQFCFINQIRDLK